MEQLLEVDNLGDALSGSLDIIVNTLNSEAGAIWFLDPKTDRLSPLFHIGPADISNISVENGHGLAGIVTKTGKSVIVEDAASDPRFDGTVFDDNGLVTKTMICVPLNNLHEVIGCVQIVNKKDRSLYDAEELKLCERMASLAAITIEEKGLLVDLGEQKEVLAVLRDVTKEYPSGDGVLQVLKGINLEIYKNEFVVILGESGCGKSTMMNIVGGMDNMTSGQLLIEGRDFSHPSDAELTRFRRRVRRPVATAVLRTLRAPRRLTKSPKKQHPQRKVRRPSGMGSFPASTRPSFGKTAGSCSEGACSPR